MARHHILIAGLGLTGLAVATMGSWSDPAQPQADIPFTPDVWSPSFPDATPEEELSVVSIDTGWLWETETGLEPGPEGTWEDNGGAITGLNGYENLGANLAPIGDVNADGYDDFAVAAPYCCGGSTDPGEIRVYLGAELGPDVNAHWAATGVSAWSSRLGLTGTISHGDVNGDGYSDLVFGEPEYGLTATTRLGRVWVYHGSADGLATSAADSNAAGTADTTLDGTDDFDRFGHTVAVGDFNGDGYDDVAVGSTLWDAPGEAYNDNSGRVDVYLGSADGVSTTASTSWEGAESLETMGTALTAGRFTDDGYDDLLIGVGGASDDLTRQGKVVLHEGSGTGLSAEPTRTWWGDQDMMRWGTELSNLRDVDGDGLDDIGMAGHRHEDGETAEGRVDVYLGSDLSAATPHFTFETDQVEARLNTVRSAGDLDADGYGDIIMGAGEWDGTYSQAGRAWLHLGGSTGLSSTSSETFTGTAFGNRLGGAGLKDATAVFTAGDVTGDGYDDLLIGSSGYSYSRGRVELRYGSASGTTDTVTTPTDPPEITAITWPTGDEGDELDFSATASDPDGGDLTFSWSFGDSSASTEEDPSHTYANSGAFHARLVVTDEDDNRVVRHGVVVIDNVAPELTVSSPDSVWLNEEHTFDAVAIDPGDDTLTFLWTLPDGTSSTEPSVTVLFDTVGSQTVDVEVSDPDGGTTTWSQTWDVQSNDITLEPLADLTLDEGELLDLTAEASNPAGHIQDFSWDFGDGSTGTGASTSHAWTTDGTFTLTLTVSTGAGGLATDTATVTVNNVDPVLGTVTIPDGTQYQASTFSATAEDVDPLTFTWTFGDGTVLTGPSVQHVWLDDGEQSVSVEVTDGDGGSASWSDTVDVATASETNDAPSVTMGDHAGTEGIAAALTAIITDPQGDHVTLAWDFGDGTTGTGPAPSHTWPDDGTWTITLTATDARGASTSATADAIITNADPSGVLSIPDELLEGSAADLSSLVSDVPADTVTTSWDFGDGSPTATGDAVSHTWTDDGPWSVTVTLTDEDGGQTTLLAEAQVTNVPPTIDEDSLPDEAMEGEAIEATLTATDPGDDDLTFTLLEGPTGMSVDADSGDVTWTPTWSQVVSSPHAVRVEVVDDDGGSDEHTWTVEAIALDADDDGLADSWELAWGLDPTDPSDGTGDLDGDGRSNPHEFEHGTDPTTWDGPDTPIPTAPDDGSVVPHAFPQLQWEAGHPHGDPLTHTVQFFGDEALTQLLREVQDLPQSTWIANPPLEDDSEVWWRVSSQDAFASSPWSETRSLRVNATPEAPSTPIQLLPDHMDIVRRRDVALTWEPAFDPDDDVVAYDLRVIRIGEDSAGLDTGTWDQPDGSLAYDVRVDIPRTEMTPSHVLPIEEVIPFVRYHWRIRAVDAAGLMSEWSLWNQFHHDPDIPPPAPAWTAPSAGAELQEAPILSVAIQHTSDLPTDVVFELRQEEHGPVVHERRLHVEPALGEYSWDIRADGVELADGTWWVHARLEEEGQDGGLTSDWAPNWFQLDQGTVPQPRPVDSDSSDLQGCGCSSTGSGAAFGWLGVLGLMGLRRRRR